MWIHQCFEQWFTLTPGGVVGTWCVLWTSIHLAWHWLPLNLILQTLSQQCIMFFCQFSLHAMKLTGCCTSVSLVFHVYVSAAYCEQYRILFHIKMRDIVQNKVDPSMFWFTLYCDIIHNNNILTKYNYANVNFKKKCHWWFPLWYTKCWLYEHKWSNTTTCMWNYKLFSSWIALYNKIRSSLNNIRHLPALISYLGHAKVISRSHDMGGQHLVINIWSYKYPY